MQMTALDHLFATPIDTLAAVRSRATEAVLGQSGVRNATLAAAIRSTFGSATAEDGSLVADPVLESALPYLNGEPTLTDLAKGTIDARVIEALTGGSEERNYRFPTTLRPYLHQLEAWTALTAPEPRSVLVSSGTGSGKTECFLVPLLHDLARETRRSGRLKGVRAIALYPLNALIASQEERLSEWTAPFAGDIRFGLYNSNMPNDAPSRTAPPEQVVDRHTLRTDPPPILVTNVTMLEYMTVRREDRPLIEASKGKLRWIILDEAHSYVGSTAAEIALLLRRVLLAFDVDPRDVRFVATSATIGEGEETRRKLQSFLSDVAGVPISKVTVIEGRRRPLDLPQASDRIAIEEALSNGASVARHPGVQDLVRDLVRAPMTWRTFSAQAAKLGVDPDRLLRAVTAPCRDGSPLVPLRIHGFLRAVPGLWTCLDSHCPTAPGEEWPFGSILTERFRKCPHCGGNVQQIVVCSECGEAFLDVLERNGALIPAPETFDLDEFAAGSEAEETGPERDEDDEGEETETGETLVLIRRLVAPSELPHARLIHVDPTDGRVYDRPTDATREFRVHDHEADMRCPACAARRGGGKRAGNLFRPIRYGAPFLIGNAIPVVLDGVPARSTMDAPLPAEGRQLLTFSDSRQGTARFAASIQTNAERNTIRSLVYFAVQDSLRPEPGTDVGKIREDISGLRGLIAANPAMRPVLEDTVRTLEAKLGSDGGLAWTNLREIVGARQEVDEWIRMVWNPERDPRFHQGNSALVQFLLLRELLRRPRRANALETMGLAHLRFDKIDRLPESSLPTAFRERALSISDWRDFLHLILTHFVRNGLAVGVAREDVRWLLPHAFPNFLIGPNSAKRKGARSWPMPKVAGSRSNIVKMLAVGLKLDETQAADREILAEVLERAWHDLLPLFATPGSGDRYALDLEQAHVAPVLRAAVCPTTRKLLDRTFLGLSPYGFRDDAPEARERCVLVDLPRHPDPYLIASAGDPTRVLAWLAEDPTVVDLRAKGLWSNLHDRIALGSPYLRSAEHSAQQPPKRLRRYESEFKAGRINALNCSTTMEMGVDIGSVSAVAMTNVPPSIANYRQRVGRAGRRGQSLATALTYTRDTPLDRATFLDPVDYLRTRVEAPKVSLDSRRITQRHVNAYLLARWFAESKGEALKSEAGAFFGCPHTAGQARPKERPISDLLAWLGRPSTEESVAFALEVVTRNSALAGDKKLLTAASEAFERAETGFVTEWSALQSQAATLGRDAAKSSVAAQLKRMCREYLLGELADRGVLPGHGFPTSVVPFVHTDKDEEDTVGDRENRFKRRNYPTRNLDVAIRDYAPGAEVVVDGLVYRSAGVTLNWKRPADEEGVEEIQNIEWHWRCSACGGAGVSRTMIEICDCCGSELEAGDAVRFLEPAGFTVDLRELPHSDIETLDYVDPEPEQVSARDAEWRPLPDPKSGRLRTSSSGLVFYSSKGGRRGTGYAICLACGRAEREKVPFVAEDVALAEHRPLRFTKANEDGTCPGNDRGFAIQRGLVLGHDITTDVAEVEFAGLTEPGIAWSIASALREALARILGVEASELGLSVTSRSTAVAGRVQIIHLYDRASGGAGYATRLDDLFEDALRSAAVILACEHANCETGCSACIMARDLFDKAEILDRKAALEFIRTLVASMAAPAEEDIPVVGATLAHDVVDELVTALTDGRSDLVLFAGASFEPGLFDVPRLSGLVRRYVDTGRTVTLAISEATLESLDSASRLTLRDVVIRNGLALRTTPTVRFPNGAEMLAMLSDGRAWATRDTSALEFGDRWGRPDLYPVVRIGTDPVQLRDVDLRTLLPEPGARFVEIRDQLSGGTVDFGERVVALLGPELQALGIRRAGRLVAVEYSDRFVRSPLTALLVLRVLRAITSTLGVPEQAVRLQTARLDSNRRDDRPWLVEHDWRDESDRAETVAALADELGLDLRFTTNAIEHARPLRLTFEHDRIEIRFDQGFGFLKPSTQVRHDFDATGRAQGRHLAVRSFVCRTIGSSHLVARTLPES